MANYVTDTQALIKFMMGKRVINEQSHQAFLAADRGEKIIIIPAVVLMEVLYLFEKKQAKNRSDSGGRAFEEPKLPI